jgi:type II secretory ATPase GspE/PulE/Tfp pilus assembly ATPase PilB-like protein
MPHEFVSPDGRPVVLSRPEDIWRAANDRYHLIHDVKLGELLVFNGVITPEQLNDVLHAQQRGAHRPIGRLLRERRWITDDDLAVALAAVVHMPVVDCATMVAERDALAAVPKELAVRAQVLPLMLRQGALVVAMNDPWARPVLDELGFLTNLRVLPVMAEPGSVVTGIECAYEGFQPPSTHVDASIHQLAAELSSEVPELQAEASDVITESSSALVRLVNTMIEDAVQRHASDIHIESMAPQTPVLIRFRVDGTLTPYLELPPRYRHAVVARLKIMSDLDIAEHRKPQDGKIDFSRFGPTAMELRVVTVPTSHGVEDVVLRLLSGAKPLPLEDIGLNAANLAALRSAFAKPYGLILICGPTGCGKTTSLHSVLRELNTGERKIWTAEDPIEISQAGLCQVQVNNRIGWTFAAAMRTFLRADPDVIMIGEMRDEETARIAIEASLTGHLVFSTLHTNSAAESIARLLEMGMDPFNFSDSLLAVLAQRLVRRLCPSCSTRVQATPDEVDQLLRESLRSAHQEPTPEARLQLFERWRAQYGDEQGRLWLHRKQGCKACDGRGYKGRMGIHELLVANDEIRHLIRHRGAAADILAKALSSQMLTIRQDGIEKIWQGLTDLSEVMSASNA